MTIVDKSLHFKTITELAGLIESGQLSPIEVTSAQLARIEELDTRLQSYATVMAESAMVQAGRAEAEIAGGHYRGPLHGVPIAVKDLCFTRGVRTMGGTRVMADFVPGFDATVVSRLDAAGAVLLGKLNLTEGAMDGYNPERGVPVNPWNPDRWSGASSSGSGVATAAGLCYGCLGSDTGGSIRLPASACGVVGIKPTWGRVSRYGVLALAESLDHVGPMTRSTADAGIMLEAMAGFDPNDPTTLPAPAPDMLEGIDRGVRGLRLGFDAQYACDGVDPDLARAMRDSVKLLGELGAEVVEVRLPPLEEYLAAWPVLCSAEAALAHEATYPSRRDDYGPWFQGWLDLGASVSGVDYARANNLRAACNGRMRDALSGVDALVCPSMPGPAFPIENMAPFAPLPKEGLEISLLRFTAPYDFNGTPTLSVPCGRSADGLPLGLQFVARHMQEPLLCRIGHAYEQATQWHDLHPPI
ncbi:MAG: amidase [Rhodospirillaceae bacterium]|nr:amidase [Rhodospirillaceae bacterium]